MALYQMPHEPTTPHSVTCGTYPKGLGFLRHTARKIHCPMFKDRSRENQQSGPLADRAVSLLGEAKMVVNTIFRRGWLTQLRPPTSSHESYLAHPAAPQKEPSKFGGDEKPRRERVWILFQN